VIHETQSGGYEEAEHAGKDDHGDDPGGNLLRLSVRYRSGIGSGSGSGLPVISGQRAVEPLRVVNEHLVRVRVRVRVKVGLGLRAQG